MWSRIHLIPLLTAEEDRDLVRRHLADKAREKTLLGGESEVYNGGRYVEQFSWLVGGRGGWGWRMGMGRGGYERGRRGLG